MSTMPYKFRNLVFEGGGVKGIAYVGALCALADAGALDNIARVGGTSAGAINAVLVGLGYTPAETKDVLWKLDFKSFMDDSWGVIRDTARLIDDYGWYKGDFFRGWMADLIKDKTGDSETTFADVETAKGAKGFKSLYLMGTNLSTHFSEVFSAETTPAMAIADAARISMSIPLFFAAKRLNNDVYVDGGVLDNYPIKLFDRKKYVDDRGGSRATPYYKRINASRPDAATPDSDFVYNKRTLGFKLDTKQEIAVFRDHAEPEHRTIGDFFDYAWALVETVMNSQDDYHLHSDDWVRTVYIDTLGVGTTDFDLPDERKDALVASGAKGAKDYLAWYNRAKPPNK